MMKFSKRANGLLEGQKMLIFVKIIWFVPAAAGQVENVSGDDEISIRLEDEVQKSRLFTRSEFIHRPSMGNLNLIFGCVRADIYMLF